MHRVLCIHELLLHIFYHLGGTSQVTCALVCKEWSDVVLNNLWKSLDSLRPLVSLLGELQQDVDIGSLTIKAPIRVPDWNAFNRYAFRVRHLVMELGKPGLDPLIFHHILRYRAPGALVLPNLSTLRVTFHRKVDFNHSTLFMGPKVKKFHLCLPKEDTEDLAIQFYIYASRMPNLSTLEIDSTHVDFPMAKIEGYLIMWVSSLRDLEHFICAPYFATSNVLTALFRLPSLRTIRIGSLGFTGSGQTNDVLHFRPSLDGNAFANLETLSFCSDYGDAAKLLEALCARRLKRIMIGAAIVVSSVALHQLLSVLKQHHSNIEELALEAARHVHGPLRRRGFGERTDADYVTMQVLEPLLELSELRSLRISYHRQVQLADDDLEKILANLPSLACLNLCADPVLAEKPLITAAVLHIIAKRCPNISDLALYMDTRMPRPSLPSSDNDHLRFANIKRIRFGTSPIADEDVPDFAFYLSKFLNPTCKIDDLTDVCWLDRKEIDKYRSGIPVTETYTFRWNHVSSLLKVLLMAWKEKEIHMQYLSSRSDVLDAWVSVLEAEMYRRIRSSSAQYSGGR